jgi:hypothetical protein
LPLDRILARRDVVLQRLLQSYQALVEEESKQLIWVVEQGALSRAYTTAVEALQGVDFTVEDLEDMCLELDAKDGFTASMGAPSGLFIAAMCNHVPANDISLNLHLFRRRWPVSGVSLAVGAPVPGWRCGGFCRRLARGWRRGGDRNRQLRRYWHENGDGQIGYSTGKYTGEGMRGGPCAWAGVLPPWDGETGRYL